MPSTHSSARGIRLQPAGALHRIADGSDDSLEREIGRHDGAPFWPSKAGGGLTLAGASFLRSDAAGPTCGAG